MKLFYQDPFSQPAAATQPRGSRLVAFKETNKREEMFDKTLCLPSGWRGREDVLHKQNEGWPEQEREKNEGKKSCGYLEKDKKTKKTKKGEKKQYSYMHKGSPYEKKQTADSKETAKLVVLLHFVQLLQWKGKNNPECWREGQERGLQ